MRRLEWLSYFSWIWHYMAPINIHWKGFFSIYFYYIYFLICMCVREDQTLMWRSKYSLSSTMGILGLKFKLVTRVFISWTILLAKAWLSHPLAWLMVSTLQYGFLLMIICGIILLLLYQMSHVHCHFIYNDPLFPFLR